jgi:hypothetical protein
MTPEVAAAIEEIQRQYEGHTILVGPDKDGGACVIVENVALGQTYEQRESWIGFHITHSCPYADVYPHFARGDLSRVDKKNHPQGVTTGHTFPQSGVVVDNNMPARPAVQISRRSNHRDNASGIETPVLKLLKVLQWLNSL